MISAARQSLQPAVVLVADRTLSADYTVLFEGIFATMQTTLTPQFLMRRLLSPALKTNRFSRANLAALGLRRIESALLAYTSLTGNDVACTTPEALPGLIGPWTRLVAVSSSDPLGRGMSNSTTVNFLSGELYTRAWTRRMMNGLRRLKEKYKFTVVAGGAGAWQWTGDPDERRRQGIDVVFEGYFETQGPRLFTDVIGGKAIAPRVIESETACENIMPIRGASILGAIELSRGCGRGCRFCTMSDKTMKHLPVETIVADLETNVAEGVTSVVSTSEDFFRYGAGGSRVSFEALRRLLVEMRRIPGLRFMQIDHANVSSILQLTDEQLSEIRRLLTWQAKSEYLWVNLGLESANGRLVWANGKGKIAPFQPDDWQEMVKQASAKLVRTGFFPVFSLILGLPGETADDVRRTLKLVKELSQGPGVMFPIFYEPVCFEDTLQDERFHLGRMRADHFELFTTCYEINFSRVPKLFEDNQRAGGVGWTKRMVIQMLGKAEIVSWHRRFARIDKDIRRRCVTTSVIGTTVPAVGEES